MSDIHSACVAKVEEAIAYVERRRERSFQSLGSNSAENWDFHLNPLLALRAVLEKHKDDGSGNCTSCFEENNLGDWDDWGLNWTASPCPTVLDIAKALGVGE